METASNLAHQVDLHCRKLITRLIDEVNSSGKSVTKVGPLLSSMKSKFITEVKNHGWHYILDEATDAKSETPQEIIVQRLVTVFEQLCHSVLNPQR